MLSTSQTTFEWGRIHGPSDWFLWGTVLAALLLLSFLVYKRDTPGLSWMVRSTLMLLRLSVYGILFVVFLDPRLRTDVSIERSSRVLLAVDSSLSMTIADLEEKGASKPIARAEGVWDAFERSSFLTTLQAHNEVAISRFGRQLLSVAELPRRAAKSPAAAASQPESVGNESASPRDWKALLPADQDQTRLGDALAAFLRQETANPLAGMILFSDGGQNAGSSIDTAIRLAKERKIPIHVVGLGSDLLPVNLRLVDLRLPSRVFRGDRVKLSAMLAGDGKAGQTVPIEIVRRPRDNDQEETVLERREVTLGEEGKPTSIEFEFLPEETGEWSIMVRTPVDPREKRTDDNSVSSGIEVIEYKTKVLVFAGGPTRDYQFLRNLLFRDKTMELSILLQTAGDPIAQDADVVLKSFPASPQELFPYDVVVALDPNWSDVPSESRLLLQQWVAKRAGGLLLQAGAIHTTRIARDQTLADLRKLYPVTLDEYFAHDVMQVASREPWPAAITKDGAASELLRLEDDPNESLDRWGQFAGFYFAYPIREIKQAASVLAEFSDPRSRRGNLARPLVVSQFYGSGRILYLGTGEIWRLRRLGERYYDRFWVGAIRTLGQGRLQRGSGHGSLFVDAERVPLGSMMVVRGVFLDEQFQPLVAREIALSMTEPDGSMSQWTMSPVEGSPGQFAVSLPTRQAGDVRLQVLHPITNEVLERRFSVEMPELEFADVRQNRALLNRLADETGGRYFALDQISELAGIVEDRSETSVFSEPPRPLWDRFWVIAVVCVLLGTEWLIRKLKSLS